MYMSDIWIINSDPAHSSFNTIVIWLNKIELVNYKLNNPVSSSTTMLKLSQALLTRKFESDMEMIEAVKGHFLYEY